MKPKDIAVNYEWINRMFDVVRTHTLIHAREIYITSHVRLDRLLPPGMAGCSVACCW
jgi:hypothetical protein